MPNDTVVIDDVRIKTLRDGRDLFIIKDQSGTEYSTMKRELAEKARTWKGGPALLSFDIKQNGDFTNRYLNDVQAAQAPSNGNLGFTIDVPQADPDEKRKDIARSVALKCAIDLACAGQLDTNNPDSITKVADYLVGWLLEAHEQMEESEIPF